MRHYPFLSDPASGLQALGILARAGITPGGPVLAVAERSAWSNYKPTVHLDPSCPRSAPNMLTLVSIAEHELADLDEDLGAFSSHEACRPSGPLWDWIGQRHELATALLALEAINEHFDLEDVDEDGEATWSHALTHFGILRAASYGLTHADGDYESERDPFVAEATNEALAALEEALDARAPALRPTRADGPLHRYVVTVDDVQLDRWNSPGAQSQAFEAIAAGGLLGVRGPHGRSPRNNAAILATPTLLDHYSNATALGPARDHESADQVFGAYDSYIQVRDALRSDGVNQDEADKAALASIAA